MMLRYTLQQPEAADRIESAVGQVLVAGFRTPDIWSEGTKKVGTREMGDAVVAALAAHHQDYENHELTLRLVSPLLPTQIEDPATRVARGGKQEERESGSIRAGSFESNVDQACAAREGETKCHW
jgi:hypothetical protein